MDNLVLPIKLQRATDTERTVMRSEFYSGTGVITFFPVDGLWACDVAGVITEHASVRDMFVYLAEVAEES